MQVILSNEKDVQDTTNKKFDGRNYNFDFRLDSMLCSDSIKYKFILKHLK